ncbi:MAG: hypothetical protein IKR04_00505 [Clostridia bacterium]|nr:hypothetical protein [Clostridia bacterium]
MSIITTIRNSLHPWNGADAWALVGFFLWVFLIWCMHDKKVGWFKASFRATIIIIILGVAVGKIFG